MLIYIPLSLFLYWIVRSKKYEEDSAKDRANYWAALIAFILPLSTGVQALQNDWPLAFYFVFLLFYLAIFCTSTYFIIYLYKTTQAKKIKENKLAAQSETDAKVYTLDQNASHESIVNSESITPQSKPTGLEKPVEKQVAVSPKEAIAPPSKAEEALLIQREATHTSALVKKPASRENKISSKSVSYNVISQEHFAEAYKEIETNNKEEGLWAMVYANTESEEAAKKKYINLRAEGLHEEELLQKQAEKQAEVERLRKGEEEAEIERLREEKEAAAKRRRKKKEMEEAKVERLRKEKEKEKKRDEAKVERLRKKKEKEKENAEVARIRKSFDAMQGFLEKKGIKIKRRSILGGYKVVYQDGSAEVIDGISELRTLYDKTYNS